MTAWVRAPGDVVNHQRLARLLPTRGLETRYAKPPYQPGAARTARVSLLMTGGANYPRESGVEYGHP